ncbi:MAG: hypothetical protein ABIO68_02390 [Sphingomicrobium sp.]
MTKLGFSTGLLLACLAGAAAAPAAPPLKSVVVESYYRVKWGNGDEFKRLYDRNERPLLKEMKRLGFVTDVSFEQPFTHMAGGPRWDYRARITYRDGIAAVESGGSYDQAFEAARARLIPDKSAFDSEQAKRMSLLEDHWDVIVDAVEE